MNNILSNMYDKNILNLKHICELYYIILSTHAHDFNSNKNIPAVCLSRITLVNDSKNRGQVGALCLSASIRIISSGLPD